VSRLHSCARPIAAVVLLIVSAQFLKLSYAVMIGLPALALTVASSLNLLSRWATSGTRIALIRIGRGGGRGDRNENCSRPSRSGGARDDLDRGRAAGRKAERARSPHRSPGAAAT
jgi:hypothetical protein